MGSGADRSKRRSEYSGRGALGSRRRDVAVLPGCAAGRGLEAAGCDEAGDQPEQASEAGFGEVALEAGAEVAADEAA
jgi:hypothetical protein